MSPSTSSSPFRNVWISILVVAAVCLQSSASASASASAAISLITPFEGNGNANNNNQVDHPFRDTRQLADEPCYHRKAQELVEVPCSADVEDIVSYVSVVFNGQEENLSGSEKCILEKGFKKVYNRLAAQKCDGFHRKLDDVNLNVRPGPSPEYDGGEDGDGDGNYQRQRRQRQNRNRKLQGGTNDMDTEESAPDNTSFFNAAGSCRGCPVTPGGSFPLFDDGFRRLMLEGVQNKNNKNGLRRLSSSQDDDYGYDDHSYTSSNSESQDDAAYDEPELADVCTCPADAVNNGASGASGSESYDNEHLYDGDAGVIGPDAPSINEFLEAYNDYIDRYVEEGRLTSITQVLSLDEFANGPMGRRRRQLRQL